MPRCQPRPGANRWTSLNFTLIKSAAESPAPDPCGNTFARSCASTCSTPWPCIAQAGLPEEQAIAKALDDFGGPEEVRGELETLHGHRLLTTIVDKSLEWKEKTMKARWLWTTSAHLALALVIALASFFIAWTMVFIVPSYEKVKSEGLLEAPRADVQGFMERADACLMALVRIANHLVNYWFLWVFLLAVVWGLFEWRVRSENKSLMRLSGLGLAALMATIGVGLMAVSLIVPYVVAVPTLYTRRPSQSCKRTVPRSKPPSANSNGLWPRKTGRKVTSICPMPGRPSTTWPVEGQRRLRFYPFPNSRKSTNCAFVSNPPVTV